MTEQSFNNLSGGKLGDSLKHGSLFSGIGGFDLAAEWMGWDNMFHCEWNEFGQRILKYYWPKAISYEDITKTDFSIHRGKIDVLTGGFPCQPYSVAGKRKGKEDERHLWPEMLRAIREIQPRWIVGENVSGIITWNGGLVFEEVQTDLEAEGYEVWANVLPAASINAPHKRDRVWFIAFNSKCKSAWKYDTGKGKRTGMEMEGNELGRCQWSKETNILKPSNNDGDASNTSNERCNDRSYNWEERQICDNQNRNAQEDKPKGNRRKCGFSEIGKVGNVANTDSTMFKRREKRNESQEGCKSINKQFRRYDKFYKSDFKEFPSQAPICDGDDGLSSRLDTITFPKWRTESVKGGGNAIVPQVALQIFKTIALYEKKEREKIIKTDLEAQTLYETGT